ncbi:uncharacterized protein [Miscanthus floridulus]|uniref:uncharacterized protein n=1 Tax=Miscanthus floridulus TaxID=154761 RepID=UPI00345B35CC
MVNEKVPATTSREINNKYHSWEFSPAEPRRWPLRPRRPPSKPPAATQAPPPATAPVPSSTLLPPPPPWSLTVLGKVPRASAYVDADGFTLVESRRRWRSRERPRVSRHRPVPSTLVGLCFNCLEGDHVAAECRFPSRCHCRCPGHRARDCKRGRFPTRQPARGRGAPRPRQVRPGRPPSPSGTVSGRSCSTDQDTSVPPVCGEHFGSPQRTAERADDPTPPPPPRSPPPSPPPGHPSTRPVSEIVVIPRSVEINAVKEALSSLALVAIVGGTRPPVPC